MKKKLTVFLVMLLTLLFSATVFAAIPSISGSKYIKTFGLSTANNTRVFTNARLNQQGTSSPYRAYNALIYASDEIYVYAMNNTYALISYPTSSGRKQGYVPTSSLTYYNFSQNALRSRNRINTYTRPGGGSYGAIYNGDSVWTVARSGNYTQVVYPAGSVYKMAWITNNDYNNYIAPIAPTPANNTSTRIQNALNWCAGKVNTTVGSGQCVAFVNAYYNYLGTNAVSGDGKDFAEHVPSGWRSIPNGVPQPGDVLVYKGAKYGHVAIYAGNNTVYQQNYNYKLRVEKTTNWSYNRSWKSDAEGGGTKYYWGCVRPIS